MTGIHTDMDEERDLEEKVTFAEIISNIYIAIGGHGYKIEGVAIFMH
jgi:hypothetical protein